MSFQHRLIINTHHASAYDLILNVLDRYGSDAFMSLFNLALFMKSSSIPVLSLRVLLAFSAPLFPMSISRPLMSFPVRKKKQQSWHSLSKKKRENKQQSWHSLSKKKREKQTTWAMSSITQTKAKRIRRYSHRWVDLASKPGSNDHADILSLCLISVEVKGLGITQTSSPVLCLISV